MKKLFAILAIMMLLVGLVKPKVLLDAEENTGCNVDKNGTIICKEDIAEGCWFNPETLEVECPVDPYFGHQEEKPRG